MTTHTEKRYPSLGLPQGFLFQHYATLDAAIADSTSERVVDLLNTHLTAAMGNKARAQFCADLEAITGFKRNEGEETGKYVARFTAHCKPGIILLKVENIGEPLALLRLQLEDALAKPLQEDEGFESFDLSSWFQSLADLHTYTLTTKPPVIGKPKPLPAYCLDGAKAIINGGNDSYQKARKLIERESDGTIKLPAKLEPVPEPGTPAYNAGVHQLAAAIHANDLYVESKRKSRFVSDE